MAGVRDNFGPLSLRPGTPWFASNFGPAVGIVGGGGIKQPAPTFSVSQKVICATNASINSGVLQTGRRPDRPGS